MGKRGTLSLSTEVLLAILAFILLAIAIYYIVNKNIIQGIFRGLL